MTSIGANALIKILATTKKCVLIRTVYQRARQRDGFESIDEAAVRSSRPGSGNAWEDLVGHMPHLGIVILDARQRHHLVDGDWIAVEIAVQRSLLIEIRSETQQRATDEAENWKCTKKRCGTSEKLSASYFMLPCWPMCLVAEHALPQVTATLPDVAPPPVNNFFSVCR